MRRAAKPWLLALALLFAASLGSTVQANTAFSVQLDWLPYGLHAPLFLALDKGWFKDAGLDVTVEDGTGSAKTITLVAAGQGDIGWANLSAMILAKNKGLPVISVAQIIRKSDIGVLVPANSGWKTPKDLEGKKLGVTPGGFISPFLPLFFQRGNADFAKATIVNALASNKVSIYVAGDIDALVTSVPGDQPSLAGKRASSAILFDTYGLPLPSFGFVANTDAIKKNPAPTIAFLQVFFKALDYTYAGHQAEAIAALRANRPHGDSDVILRATLDAFEAFLSDDNTRGKPNGWQSPADWASVIHLMTDANLLPNALPATDYYTNTLIESR